VSEDTKMTVGTAPAGPLDRSVGQPVPERDKPLSYRQRETMKRAPDSWADLPSGMGCTNATLAALEKRGLVEIRIDPAKRLAWYSG
jgi:hypothetical protein